jgi:hypothetical protein
MSRATIISISTDQKHSDPRRIAQRLRHCPPGTSSVGACAASPRTSQDTLEARRAALEQLRSSGMVGADGRLVHRDGTKGRLPRGYT